MLIEPLMLHLVHPATGSCLYRCARAERNTGNAQGNIYIHHQRTLDQ
jgi:hypothetical protein